MYVFDDWMFYFLSNIAPDTVLLLKESFLLARLPYLCLSIDCKITQLCGGAVCDWCYQTPVNNLPQNLILFAPVPSNRCLTFLLALLFFSI